MQTLFKKTFYCNNGNSIDNYENNFFTDEEINRLRSFDNLEIKISNIFIPSFYNINNHNNDTLFIEEYNKENIKKTIFFKFKNGVYDIIDIIDNINKILKKESSNHYTIIYNDITQKITLSFTGESTKIKINRRRNNQNDFFKILGLNREIEIRNNIKYTFKNRVNVIYSPYIFFRTNFLAFDINESITSNVSLHENIYIKNIQSFYSKINKNHIEVFIYDYDNKLIDFGGLKFSFTLEINIY